MTAWLKAFGVASFVWFVPLVGPHAVFAPGPSLWAVLLRKGTNLHFGLGLATVLVVHAGMALLLWLVRRQPAWARAGILFLGMGGATVVLNSTFLVAIPAFTLIERDSRPETGDWPEDCARAGFDLPLAPTPALARAGRVLVRPVTEGAPLAWMAVPGCAVTATSIPMTAAALSTETGGTTLYAFVRPPDARYEWCLAPAQGPSRSLTLDWRPGGATPVLLSGASHVAWIERRQTEAGIGSSEPPYFLLAVQALDGAAASRTPLDGLEAGSWRLLDGQGPAGPFLVVREVPREFRIVDAKGAPVGVVVPQPGPAFERTLSEVVLHPGGWLGFDVYAEERRYLVAWDLPGGRGRIEEPKGRGITSAAADPDGRYVAYSTTTTLNVGSVSDGVAVVSARDGRDLWRRRLPRYARARVALFPGHFAWSDSTSTPPCIRVLRLPEP